MAETMREPVWLTRGLLITLPEPGNHQPYHHRENCCSSNPAQHVHTGGVHPSTHDLAVGRDQHDQQHEEWSRKSLDHSRPHQSLHGIDPEEVQTHCDHSEDGNGQIETFGLGWPVMQPML